MRLVIQTLLACLFNLSATHAASVARLGVLTRLHAGDGTPLVSSFARMAASANLAAYHINNRIGTLTADGVALLPDNFTVSLDLSDSWSSPTTGVKHAIRWVQEDIHVIIGAYRSAVAGPVAIVASTNDTPVLSWGSSAPSLSDKGTYPTFSRVSSTDLVVTSHLIGVISEMGWINIAVLYVDDSWGRGVVQGLQSFAKGRINIQAAVSHFPGDEASISNAIQALAESGATVILSAVFDQDLPAIIREAISLGLLQRGYVWITTADVMTAQAVINAADTEGQLIAALSGWITAELDPMEGERIERFDQVLRSTPLSELEQGSGLTADALETGLCSMYCGLMYDAVWSAAIAISRTGVGADGAVDKAQLLANIRSVAYEGATGAVEFDSFGDRDSSSIPLLLSNLRQRINDDGSAALTLDSLLTWRYTPSGGLERVSADPPLWIGGEETWETGVGQEDCDAESVYSSATKQCEKCAVGTEKEEGVCVPYNASVGILVALHREDGVPYGDSLIQIAASALMAVHHINTRVGALVTDVEQLLPPHFHMVFEMRDTWQSKTRATQHVFDFQRQHRHVIVGAARSSVTIPVVLAAQVGNTPVVSFASTTPALSDKEAYPLSSRVVIRDSTVARGIISTFTALGWTRVSVLAVDDEYGRGFAQYVQTLSGNSGVELVDLQLYEYMSQESMDIAMHKIRDSGSKIFLALILDNDFENLVEAGSKYGIMGKGYVWFSATELVETAQAYVDASADPAAAMELVIGFFTAHADVLYGGKGARFQEVLVNEPIAHMNNSIFGDWGLQQASLTSGACSSYCALIYDAVWTAAIAVARARPTPTQVDKTPVFDKILDLSFTGATGWVEFDPKTGDRSAVGIPILISNFRPVSPTGRREAHTSLSLELEAVPTWMWEEGGEGLVRVSETEPYWPGGARTWDAPLDGSTCATGEIFTDSTLRCEKCPAGTAAQKGRCEPCPLGSIAEDAGSVSCSECQLGYANRTGMSMCYTCPRYSARGPSSKGINESECECIAGYYTRYPNSTGPIQCTVCPTGAICEGGKSMPYPRPGFWGDVECINGTKECDETRWDKFIECVPPGDCKGGPDFACTRGRKGRMCRDPEDGWTVVGDSWWLECGKYGGVGSALGMFATIMIWFGLNGVASSTYNALNIALLFIQLTALISQYGLKWHSNLTYLNIALGIGNFDVDFVTPRCIFENSWGPFTSFYFQILLPFMFGLVYIVFFLLRDGYRRRLHVKAEDVGRSEEVFNAPLWKRVGKQIASFVLVNYNTLSTKTLSSFRCNTFPDGNRYLVHAPQVECWQGWHLLMVTLSCIYIVGILIGLPVMLFLVIRHHKRQGTLHSPLVDWQWGFVHSSYEMDYKFWEVVLVIRRFGVALITVTIDEPMIQAAATIILLTILIAAHVFTRPFIHSGLDVLDFICLCGCSMYVLAGLLMYPSVTKQAQGHVCTSDVYDPFCEKDKAVKEAISYVSLCSVFVTLFLAGMLTVFLIREARASMAAIKRITKQLNGEFWGAETSWGRAQREVVMRSANKVTLADILDGPQLLRWVKAQSRIVNRENNGLLDLDPPDEDAMEPMASVESAESGNASSPAIRTRARKLMLSAGSTAFFQVEPKDLVGSSENFMCVEEKVQQLTVDLTQSSSEPIAAVMRHMCEIAGFLDYLSWKDARALEGLFEFVEDLTRFHELSRVYRHPCNVTGLVRFEFRPVLAYWLMSCRTHERETFRQLVSAMLKANNKDLVELKRPASFYRRRRASTEVAAAPKSVTSSLLSRASFFIRPTSTHTRSENPEAPDGGPNEAKRAALARSSFFVLKERVEQEEEREARERLESDHQAARDSVGKLASESGMDGPEGAGEKKERDYLFPAALHSPREQHSPREREEWSFAGSLRSATQAQSHNGGERMPPSPALIDEGYEEWNGASVGMESPAKQSADQPGLMSMRDIMHSATTTKSNGNGVHVSDDRDSWPWSANGAKGANGAANGAIGAANGSHVAERSLNASGAARVSSNGEGRGAILNGGGRNGSHETEAGRGSPQGRVRVMESPPGVLIESNAPIAQIIRTEPESRRGWEREDARGTEIGPLNSSILWIAQDIGHC